MSVSPEPESTARETLQTRRLVVRWPLPLPAAAGYFREGTIRT
jgi:hypothetical protein